MMSRKLNHLLDVARVLVIRDQKARYRNTALGVLWVIANPLLFLSTFYVLFGLILKIEVESYAAFLFVGIVAWTWLQTSLVEATTSITLNPGFVGQPGLPVVAIPIAVVTSNFIGFLITLPILIILIAVEGIVPGVTLIVLPLIVAVQFVLILAVAYLFAALNVWYRDTQQIVMVLLQLGYFTTPIFYDAKSLSATAQQVLSINPMLHILDAYRDVLLRNEWPNFGALAVVAILACVGLYLTLKLFRDSRQTFLEDI